MQAVSKNYLSFYLAQERANNLLVNDEDSVLNERYVELLRSINAGVYYPGTKDAKGDYNWAYLIALMTVCSFIFGGLSYVVREKLFRKEGDKELRRRVMQQIEEAEQRKASYTLA